MASVHWHKTLLKFQNRCTLTGIRPKVLIFRIHFYQLLNTVNRIVAWLNFSPEHKTHTLKFIHIVFQYLLILNTLEHTLLNLSPLVSGV